MGSDEVSGAMISAIGTAITVATVTFALGKSTLEWANTGSIVLVDSKSREVSTIEKFNELQDAAESADIFNKCQGGYFTIEALYEDGLVIVFKGIRFFAGHSEYSVYTGMRISTYERDMEIRTGEIADARQRFVTLVASQDCFPEEIRVIRGMDMEMAMNRLSGGNKEIMNLRERAAANAITYHSLPFSARNVAHALLSVVGPAAGEMDRSPPQIRGRLMVVEV